MLIKFNCTSWHNRRNFHLFHKSAERRRKENYDHFRILKKKNFVIIYSFLWTTCIFILINWKLFAHIQVVYAIVRTVSYPFHKGYIFNIRHCSNDDVTNMIHIHLFLFRLYIHHFYLSSISCSFVVFLFWHYFFFFRIGSIVWAFYAKDSETRYCTN